MASRVLAPALLGVLLGLTGSTGYAGAPEPAPAAPKPTTGSEAATVPRADLDGPRGSAPTVRLGEKSRLPYPATADVWVDAEGSPGGGVRRAAMVVYRPDGDRFSWEQMVALLAGQSLVAPQARAEFQAISAPTAVSTAGPTAVTTTARQQRWDTRVYRSTVPGELLVTGLIRDLTAQRLLVYVVQIAGKLDNTQAIMRANALVNTHTERARILRNGIPIPEGSLPSEPEVRIDGPTLRVLQQAIQADRRISARMKAAARTVLADAGSVRRTVWRTSAALTDLEFFEFFAQAARRLNWGDPLAKDGTDPGQPVVLYQVPGVGVVMVKAQPTPLGSTPDRTAKPTTSIFVLEIRPRTSPAAIRTLTPGVSPGP